MPQQSTQPSQRSSSLGKIRNSITNVAHDVSSGVSRPSLTRNSFTRGSIKSPLALGPPSEDTKWHIGGRYQVAPSGATVWPTANVGNGEPLGEIKPKELVLMLSIMEEGALRSRGPAMGLVIASTQESPPGWVVLEDITGGTGSLLRRRLEGSWEMHARYTVTSAATVRRGKALATDCVGELKQGEEVVALELDFNEGDHGTKPRLRMKVSSENGVVGWISPETSSGYQLLNPLNLLSTKVVEIHRRSLSAGRGRLSFRGKGFSGDSGDAGSGAAGRESSRGPRASYAEGDLLPWIVHGQYRVLEKVVARDKPSLTSTEIGKISQGSLVSFQQMEVKGLNTTRKYMWIPLALVIVDEGPELGRKGWIPCSANDGHDLVDTRDQLEFAKVKDKLACEQRQAEEKHRAAEQRRAAAAESAKQRLNELNEQKLATKLNELNELKAQKEAEQKRQQEEEEALQRAQAEKAEREAEEQKKLQLKKKTPACGACFSFVGSPKKATAVMEQAKVPLIPPTRTEEPEAEDQEEEEDDEDDEEEEEEEVEEEEEERSHHHNKAKDNF